MKLFKWVAGRQSTTQYEKYCLLYFKFLWWGFDCYLLRYKENQHLVLHRDPVENGHHYRINIKLKGKCKFWCSCTRFRIGDIFVFFRPDLYYHDLVTHTKVLKLSLGYVKFSKLKKT